MRGERTLRQLAMVRGLEHLKLLGAATSRANLCVVQCLALVCKKSARGSAEFVEMVAMIVQ